MQALLTWLCVEKVPPAPATLEAWWQATRPVRERFEVPAHRAAASGLYADRLGWAFVSGYQAALKAMFPLLDRQAPAALCATESGGARPRDIHTSLTPRGDGFELTGAKQWTTAAPFAETLFVVARLAEEHPDPARPKLKVVQVSPTAPGVTVTPMETMAFVPEIPHASVTFEKVQVDKHAVLHGDGYADALKPFRTIEDLHVNAAVLGYLVGASRRGDWPKPEREELLAHVATCVALAALLPSASETHLALAGFLTLARRTVARCAPYFERLPAEERARWERDQPLLHVAERVRAARLVRAWERLETEKA